MASFPKGDSRSDEDGSSGTPKSAKNTNLVPTYPRFGTTPDAEQFFAGGAQMSPAHRGHSHQRVRNLTMDSRSRERLEEGYKSDESTNSSPGAVRSGVPARTKKTSHKRLQSGTFNGLWKNSAEPKSGSLFLRAEGNSSEDEEHFVYKSSRQGKVTGGSVSGGHGPSQPPLKAHPTVHRANGLDHGGQNGVYLALDGDDGENADGEGDEGDVGGRRGCARRCWKYCRKTMVYWCMCWGCFAIVLAVMLLSYTLFLLPLQIQSTNITIRNVDVPTEANCMLQKECYLSFDLGISVMNRNQQSVDITSTSLTTFIAFQDQTMKTFRWDASYSSAPSSVGGEGSAVVVVNVKLDLKGKGMDISRLNKKKFLIRTGGVMHYRTIIGRDKVISETKRLCLASTDSNVKDVAWPWDETSVII